MDDTRYKIALVDDNAAALAQGKALLQEHFKVFTLQSAQALFDYLDHDCPDLILLDLAMPEMDGFEIITKLKSNANHMNIPVIFLTSKKDPESEKRGFALGAADYVTKPFSGPILQNRISNHIRYRNTLSESIAAKEHAELVSKTKSDFLAMMSHEIRTPMNSVVGYAELAMDSLEIDEVPHLKEYLSKIKESTLWLLNIINDLLDINKIEAGKLKLDSIPFDMHSVFTRCQSVILPDASAKGIDVHFYAEPIPHKKLLGDPIRVFQALLNLLSNAIKFTDTGTVRFSSITKASDSSKVLVYFEIKDTGIGMTDEQLAVVFDPFVQADTGTMRNYGGTGLGLAIAKSLIEQMGGNLHVESKPSIGSTFSFEISFNAIDVPGDDTEDYTELKQLEKPCFDGLVLICDDHRLNQQLICEHLEKVGLKTIVAENGKQGVDIVQQRLDNNEKAFDLIFMDIFMPVMDGVEAAKRITALNTGTPIVALTANIMVSELEKYAKHGMRDCLGKPFTTQELWQLLLKYLIPVSLTAIDEDCQRKEDAELIKMLSLNFVKFHKDTYANIEQALKDGDTVLAARIAHTLKGNAGQIGRQRLREAAAAIDDWLYTDPPPRIMSHTEENTRHFASLMDNLKTELCLALDDLEPLLIENAANSNINAGVSYCEPRIREILNKLEHMLSNHNPDCIRLLDELAYIPESDELAQQIEDLEFEKAALALRNLRTKG